jgi:hypothetical protein
VKVLVDRHLAHKDRKALAADAVPSRGDARDAIDVIVRIYRRYVGRMTGLGNTLLLPRFDHDREAVFRQPWM